MNSNENKVADVQVSPILVPQVTYQEQLYAKKQNILLRLQNIGSPYLLGHSVLVLIFGFVTFIGLVTVTSEYGIFAFNLFILTGLYVSAGISTIILGTNIFLN